MQETSMSLNSIGEEEMRKDGKTEKGNDKKR